MVGSIVRKVFGSKNDRQVKRMAKAVKNINAVEESLKSLDDEALKAKTAEFKKRLQDGETLDDLLPASSPTLLRRQCRLKGQ